MNSIQLNANLNFQQLVDSIKQLSSKEKMLINDVIWEENMDIPLAHQTLVLNRIKEAKKHPEKLMDWDEASKKLKP